MPIAEEILGNVGAAIMAGHVRGRALAKGDDPRKGYGGR
jgi:hypothetical protein